MNIEKGKNNTVAPMPTRIRILPSDKSLYINIAVAAVLTSLLPIIDRDVKGEIWFSNKLYFVSLYENLPALVIYFALFFGVLLFCAVIIKLLIAAGYWLKRQITATRT
jgi:small basic protein